MAILKTTIDIRDAAFAENTAVMRGLAEDLHAKVFEVMQGEGKARDRHVSRGKLLPRDRMRTLLDPGTFVVEGTLVALWRLSEIRRFVAGFHPPAAHSRHDAGQSRRVRRTAGGSGEASPVAGDPHPLSIGGRPRGLGRSVGRIAVWQDHSGYLDQPRRAASRRTFNE
jgi:hypothetical protein